MLALQFPVDSLPVRFGVPPMAPLAAPEGVKRRLQVRVAHPLRQRPRKPGHRQPLQRLAHRRRRHAQPARDLPRRHLGRKLQANDLAHIAHRHSFRWHRSLPWVAKGADLITSAAALVTFHAPGGIIPFRWATSSRNAGRHHPVTAGGIISFWWAASPGISMPPGLMVSAKHIVR